jgi:hypothetical protein
MYLYSSSNVHGVLLHQALRERHLSEDLTKSTERSTSLQADVPSDLTIFFSFPVMELVVLLLC